jgi:large subunit ribosomal protein L29
MPTAAELAELDDDELSHRIVEYRRELLNLRFQIATSQLDNTARLSQVKRDIARAMTLVREREIALAEGEGVLPVVHQPSPERRAAQERAAAEAEQAAAEEQEIESEAAEEDLVEGEPAGADLDEDDLEVSDELEDEELTDDELDEGEEFDETDDEFAEDGEDPEEEEDG